MADYFNFTRKDRIGLLAACSLIALLFALPSLVQHMKGPGPPATDTAWITALRQLELTDSIGPEGDGRSGFPAHAYAPGPHTTSGSRPVQLFYFDPNRLPATGWKRLGLREKTIQTILNYRAKGGHFHRPEDLQRVYGLHTDEYERLAPFIRLEAEPSRELNANDLVHTEPIYKPRTRFASSTRPVDINIADTAAFIALPGIGSRLAARIVSFRDKLGGFYSISQVGEIYGLPDSTFQSLKQFFVLNDPGIRKIHINTATLDELKAHPYIRYTLANPILAYRKEHGPFSRLEDLKDVMAVTEEVYKKIIPYLEL